MPVVVVIRLDTVASPVALAMVAAEAAAKHPRSLIQKRGPKGSLFCFPEFIHYKRIK
jgi:hypothetical protein